MYLSFCAGIGTRTGTGTGTEKTFGASGAYVVDYLLHASCVEGGGIRGDEGLDRQGGRIRVCWGWIRPIYTIYVLLLDGGFVVKGLGYDGPGEGRDR